MSTLALQNNDGLVVTLVRTVASESWRCTIQSASNKLGGASSNVISKPLLWVPILLSTQHVLIALHADYPILAITVTLAHIHGLVRAITKRVSDVNMAPGFLIR